MIDIKFHCDEHHFTKDIVLRAFSYKNYSIEMHSHDFYEINIVMSGTGDHCIEHRKLPVSVGDVFVIPPMIAHAYTNTSNLEVYHILLKRDYVTQNRTESQQVQGFLQLMEIEPFLRSNLSNSFFLHLNVSQMLLLKQELSFIDDSNPYVGSENSFLKRHAMWKLLYWFSSLLHEQNTIHPQKEKIKYEHQVLQALEYIHQNYSKKITIEVLCHRLFLSRSTFLRAFKSVCGISPMEYLNQYRCKTAQEHLALHKSSKTEIALNCGYYDLSHMERMLKNSGRTLI